MQTESKIAEFLTHQITEKADYIACSKVNGDFLSVFHLVIKTGIFIVLAFMSYIIATTNTVTFLLQLKNFSNELAFSLFIIFAVIISHKFFAVNKENSLTIISNKWLQFYS